MVCFPLKSKKFTSTSNIKTGVILLWVLAFILALPLVKLGTVSDDLTQLHYLVVTF